LNSRERYLDKASRMYHTQLKKDLRTNPGNLAGSYLYNHGLDVKDNHIKTIVSKYQLGLVTDPINIDDARFEGWLAIPYITKAGIKGIRFRNLDPNAKPKYGQHAGQKGRLYNTNAYFDAGNDIGLAEGEIDAIVATEMLGIPTLGVPGVEMWTAHNKIWAPGFKNFSTVFVFTDGDPEQTVTRNGEVFTFRPGEELGKAVQESLGFKAKIIPSPEGFDVSSMVADGRSQELIAKTKENSEDDGEI
jgi:hypothetical protein